VEQPPTLKKHWELTPVAFAGLLTSLDADQEAAAEKYVLLQRKLGRFFEWNNARQPAEELANRVLDVVARKLAEGERIGNLNAYCNEVARRLLKDSFKQPEQVELEAWTETGPAHKHDSDETREQESRLACLEQCLGTLPGDNRLLITDFYRGEGRARIERRQELAERHGISRNALGNRVQRLLDKLEQCVGKCLRAPVRR
jgi:DNA-directed RNA polymerase specialized sigma24 family protein